jgi:hypothetical protein
MFDDGVAPDRFECKGCGVFFFKEAALASIVSGTDRPTERRCEPCTDRAIAEGWL